MDKEIAPRIPHNKARPVELTRPNTKTMAAMEEARAIKAGYGNVFDTADKLLQSLERDKVAK